MADANQLLRLTPPTKTKIYKTAIYARLSLEDSGKKDSDTLENQIYLVKQFVKGQHDLELVAVFADNGETGLKFDRPQFNEMLGAVRRGDVTCVVVKDLSRFGRCYIEIGNYLDKIFPFLGTRFISVNDGYDNHNPTSNHDGLTISLKSLISNFYSKDLSKKIRTAYETKQRKGEFIGAIPAYGYLRCPVDKSKLVVNSELAPIVRDIFEWVVNGDSYTSISRRLNGMDIPSPRKYQYLNGLAKHESYATAIWKPETVKHLVKNPVYAGYMSQGKRKSRLLQGLPSLRLPSEQWINVPDMHEAIITHEKFEAVAKVLANKKVAYQQRNANALLDRNEHIFTGIIYCGDCGARMKRIKKVNLTCVTYIYNCPEYAKNKLHACVGAKYVREDRLTEVVWASIKLQMDLCTDMCKLIKKARKNNVVKLKTDNINRQITDAQRRIQRIETLLKGLYSSYSDKILTEAEYRDTKAAYQKEKRELESQLERSITAKAKHRADPITENRWASSLMSFESHQVLTKDMLLALIERIEITELNVITIAFKHRNEYEVLSGEVAEYA